MLFSIQPADAFADLCIFIFRPIEGIENRDFLLLDDDLYRRLPPNNLAAALAAAPVYTSFSVKVTFVMPVPE
jgi:hypothetical protein